MKNSRKRDRARSPASVMSAGSGTNPKYVPTPEATTVSPHVLRHTFLRKLAETKGVQYAKEASGHKTDRYIWRYVKPDQQTLADAIDALD